LVRDTFQFGSEVAIPEEILALTPLQIMARVMHSRYAAGDHAGALSAASAAAPYVHARLSMSEMNIHHTTSKRSDDDIAHEIEALRRRIEAARQAEVAQNTPLVEGKVEQHAALHHLEGPQSYEEMPVNAASAEAKTTDDAA
jgi:hypothetical protein